MPSKNSQKTLRKSTCWSWSSGCCWIIRHKVLCCFHPLFHLHTVSLFLCSVGFWRVSSNYNQKWITQNKTAVEENTKQKGTKLVPGKSVFPYILYLFLTLSSPPAFLRTKMQRHETHRMERAWIHGNMLPITQHWTSSFTNDAILNIIKCNAAHFHKWLRDTP